MNKLFNITNSFEHPTRPGHTIFRFYQKGRAEMFGELLKKDNIWHETDEDEKDGRVTYFFGIKNGDLKVVNQNNYLVSAKFRKKIIPNVYLRWSIIILSLAILTLAIIGAIKT